MVKPITTSPAVRRAVLGTMLTGIAVTGAFAANNRNNTAEERPQYTEVSSAASSAVKAMAMPVVNSDKNTHNAQVDKVAYYLCKNEEEIQATKQILDAKYAEDGLYGASIELQLMCDDELLRESVRNFQKETSKKLGEELMYIYAHEELSAAEIVNLGLFFRSLGIETENKKITEDDISNASDELASNCDNVLNYLNNDFLKLRYSGYGNVLSEEALKLNGKPTAEKASAAVDQNVKNILKNNQAGQNEYFAKVKKFDLAQNGSKTVAQKANLISYKVFTLDSIIMKKVLNGIDYFKNNKKFNEYYEKEFLSKEPKPIK